MSHFTERSRGEKEKNESDRSTEAVVCQVSPWVFLPIMRFPELEQC